MAIEIKLAQNEWEKFVPTFRGNDELPLDEQISCEIKYLSQQDSDRLQDLLINQARKNKSKTIEFSKANKQIIHTHVKNIKNVSMVNPDGSKKDITIMDELYKIPALKGLYEEIANALDASNALDDDNKKN